jgi:ribosomal protein L35
MSCQNVTHKNTAFSSCQKPGKTFKKHSKPPKLIDSHANKGHCCQKQQKKNIRKMQLF